MYLEQFTYEVRHVDGVRNATADGMSRIFEDLSSLHIANLMATAPTDEQARREREQGIIAPSTRVCCQHQLELSSGVRQVDEIPEGPDGSGGSDEALFAGLYASGELRLPELEPEFESKTGVFAMFCASELSSEISHDDEQYNQMVEEQSEGVAIEDASVQLDETEDQSGDTFESEQLKEGILEAKDRFRYGVGYHLLESMGWVVGAGIGSSCACWNEVIEARNRGRAVGDTRGLGMADSDRVTVRTPSSEEILKRKIQQVHNSVAGHVGAVRTYRRLRMLPDFPWGMKTSDIHAGVQNWCQSCLICNKVWRLRGDPQRAKSAVIRQRPFTEVAMDLIVIKEPDIDGNRNILVLIDSFSRAVELYPLKTGDAESVVECLFDCYTRWGQPMQLRCDGAKAFLSSVCKYFNRMMKVKVKSIEPYSPYQNGQVERSNQEIMRHLRAMIVSEESGPNSQWRWGLLAAAARRIINNTVNWETGVSPNELLYGGFADTELSLFGSHPAVGEGQPVAGWVLAKELEETQAELLRRSEKYQEELMTKVQLAAAAAGLREIYEGEWVLVKRGGMSQRPKSKLQCRYMGPYLVLQRPDPTSSIVTCQHLATKSVHKFHMSELQVVKLENYQSVSEAIPVALRDEWTYLIDSIVAHRPVGRRRLNSGKLRPKGQYDFLVKYALLPESTEVGEENPCWQPWVNCQHLTALRDYCAKPEVLRDLGANFYVSDGDD
jgi:hypothetical protein